MSVGSNRTEERLLSFESICREHGLSITPQRVAIYKELISSSEHPSAITIYKKVSEYYPNISLDTVNRTLLTFHKIGLAKAVGGSGDPKRFDPNLEPHHHFRCVRCGDRSATRDRSHYWACALKRVACCDVRNLCTGLHEAGFDTG